MNAATAKLGPFFTTSEIQPHPGKRVHDLGIVMTWGKPRQEARLYHNLRENAPKAFSFDFVSIHEDDAIEDFDYQPTLARETRYGTFFPLSAYLAKLYELGNVNRNIFSMLAELDNLLPKERLVTAEDDKYSPISSKPKPQAPADPPTGLLATELEMQGFRITTVSPENGRVSLEIDWLPKPGGRLFFTGILELRQIPAGISGLWVFPGPCGVNHLLQREFQKLCASPNACLTPAGIKHCFKGVSTQTQMSARHVFVWPTICALT